MEMTLASGLLLVVLTTVVTAWFHFFYKTRMGLIAFGYTEGPMIQQPILSSLVFCCMSAIVSPVILFCVIIPDLKEAFANGYKTAMEEIHE